MGPRRERATEPIPSFAAVRIPNPTPAAPRVRSLLDGVGAAAALLLAVVAVGSARAQVAPRAPNPWDDYIAGVRVGGIDNLGQPEVERRSTSDPVGYTDYRGLGATPLTPGTTVAVTVEVATKNWHPREAREAAVRIGLDADGDGALTDAEMAPPVRVEVPPNWTAGAIATVVRFAVPTGGGFSGTTTLRIGVGREFERAPTSDYVEYGEFEDYAVDLLSAEPDDTPPSVRIIAKGPLNGAEGVATVRFSENVRSLDLADFTLVGAEGLSLTGSGRRYLLRFAVTGADSVYVALPANRAADFAGNGNEASATVAVAAARDPLQTDNDGYCVPYGVRPWNDYIAGVEVDDRIANATQADPRSESAEPAGYRLYGAASAPFTAGETATLRLRVVSHNYDPNNPRPVTATAWIDANRDGAFTPAERVASEVIEVPANVEGRGLLPVEAELPFTVPLDAARGASRLRVAIRPAGPASSCQTAVTGEFEDYPIALIPVDRSRQEPTPVSWLYVPADVQLVGDAGVEVGYDRLASTYLVGCERFAAAENGVARLRLGEDFLADSSYFYFGLVGTDVLDGAFDGSTDQLAYFFSLQGAPLGGVYTGNLATAVAGGALESEPGGVIGIGSELELRLLDGVAQFVRDGRVVREVTRPGGAEGFYHPVLVVNRFGRDDRVDAEVAITGTCATFAVEPVVESAVRGRAGGAVRLVTLGGTPPYRVSWSDGAAADALYRSALAPGTYAYVVEDGMGLVTRGSVRVREVGTVAWREGAGEVAVDGSTYAARCDAGACSIASSTFEGTPRGVIEVTVLEDYDPADGDAQAQFTVGLRGRRADGSAGVQALTVFPALGEVQLLTGYGGADKLQQPLVRESDKRFVRAGDVFVLTYGDDFFALDRNGRRLYTQALREGADGTASRLVSAAAFVDVYAGGDREARLKVRTSFPVGEAETPLAYVLVEPEPPAWPLPVRDHVVPVTFRHRYSGGELRPVTATLTDPRDPRRDYLAGQSYVPTPGTNRWAIRIPPSLEGIYLLTLDNVDYDERRYLWVKCSPSGAPEYVNANEP